MKTLLHAANETKHSSISPYFSSLRRIKRFNIFMMIFTFFLTFINIRKQEHEYFVMRHQISLPDLKLPNITELNKKQTEEFYKIQVIDQGQKPTRLFYRENKQYVPIIITQISGMIISDIEPFFNTLNCTGYNGDLLVLYSNLSQEVKNFVNSFRFDFRKIIMIEVTSTIPYLVNTSFLNSLKWKCDYCDLKFVSCDERFELIYCLYKNHYFEEYNFIFITDSRDVLFQTDFTQYSYDEGVYIAEEARYAVRNSMYWIDMVNRSFLPKIQDNWSDLCVGTLILIGNGFSFLEDLHKEIMILKPYVYQRPNFQGTMIILVYNNTFNYKPGFLHIITCEHGIVESFGIYYYHFIRFRRLNRKLRKNYSIYNVQLHDHNHIFYNSDYQAYSILHHVNRFKEIYQFTYPYLKKSCLKSKINI